MVIPIGLTAQRGHTILREDAALRKSKSTAVCCPVVSALSAISLLSWNNPPVPIQKSSGYPGDFLIYNIYVCYNKKGTKAKAPEVPTVMAHTNLCVINILYSSTRAGNHQGKITSASLDDSRWSHDGGTFWCSLGYGNVS